MDFDPIVPLLALADLLYLGITLSLFIVVEIGAAMMVESTILICSGYGGWPLL